jgi:hypothetical protein
MHSAIMRRAVAAVVLFAALPLSAQFSQYTQPGSLAQDAPELNRETLETAVEGARWRFGPLRVQPWIGFRDAGWYKNPDGQDDGETDFSATGGAGARLYLPAGPKTFVALHALPEYVWWQKASERRRINGRYGVGVFAFFNRLTLNVTATRADARSPLAAELPREVNHRQDRLELATEVDLTHSLSLFADAAETEYSVVAGDDDPESRRLGGFDRTERVARGGLRLHLGSKWTLGVGAEQSETEFPAGVLDRSSRGTSPLFEVRFEGNRFGAAADVVERSLEARANADFVAVDETTGGLRVEWHSHRLRSSLYARRELGLSLESRYPYFLGDLYGLGLNLDLGARSQLLFFFETGRNDYVTRGVEFAPRRDDLQSIGAQWTFDLGRSLRMIVGASNSQVDSNQPGADRELTSVRAGVVLGGGGPWA